jgi:hypothetical protein
MIAVIIGTATAGDQPDAHKSLKVEYSQLMSGHSFLRDDGDQTNASVIWSQDGLREFLKKYPIQIEGLNPVLDGKKVLLVAFSDQLPGAFCDGVSHVTNHYAGSFYVDLHDSGIKFKRAAAPPGKKYSAWVLISIDRPTAISSVRVREQVVGGLSQQFGTP